ncbi:MAG: hypothetical protein CSB55_07380 [Candidatus Cloacimonadota bacterium]|nr:MAG: hypothetical protein CSB55_07380 [Candidatus Cloacimonadota bacterium]
MKKFFGKVLKLATISGVIYVAVKIGNKVKSICTLSKTLPTFLKERTGVKPNISLNFLLFSLKISLMFDENIDMDVDDLHEAVLEYIDDFHPELSSLAISVDVDTAEKCESENVEEAAKDDVEGFEENKEDESPEDKQQ